MRPLNIKPIHHLIYPHTMSKLVIYQSNFIRVHKFHNISLTYPQVTTLYSQESPSLCHSKGLLEIRTKIQLFFGYKLLIFQTVNYMNNTNYINSVFKPTKLLRNYKSECSSLIPTLIGVFNECKTYLCFEFISHSILILLYPYLCKINNIFSNLGFVGLLMKSN